MADAAAFFANKKKKKKAFKFNANNIDASTIEKKIHVEAPALSTDNDVAMIVSPVDGSDLNALDSTDGAEQWDDEALAATLQQKKAVTATNVELLDMKALDLKLSDQTDIQEKLRVEENKAKLAAAREAMEKEAQRLKEEKERKEQDNSGTKPRFGTAAAGLSAASGGGKWLPPHMRGGTTTLASRLGAGPGSQKFDTEDENLFPDLAAADAILEKQKAQAPAYKVAKKAPAGGGSAWGSKPEAPAKKTEEPPSDADQATQEEEPKTAESEESGAAAPASVAETDAVNNSSSTVSTTTASKAPIKPTKKKKKDLSTFKTTS